MFTSCSAIAGTASFAGYVQASNNQDFALLSTIIGDNTFNVTFSANGQLDFSYFAQGMLKTASLNLVDNNIFEGAGDVNVMAGTFTVTSPIDTTFLLDGALFLLPPPMFADIPNLKSHPALSQVVPDDSVVQTSSLMPVTVSSGCTSCGLLPVYDGGWAPAPSIRVSPFLSAFAIFDETEPAPEPSTAVLFGLALLGAGVFQLRRSQYFRPKP